MPEGPSIVILRETISSFKGQRIVDSAGDAAIDFNKLNGQKIIDLKSWGKHFLICFPDFFVRIHLMMFGTYKVNEHKQGQARLHFKFVNGEVNFYTCQVSLIEKKVEEVYNWETDIMSELWNASVVEKKLDGLIRTMVCDALLNQEIFSGVGNIIKNESLFNARIHPQSMITTIPLKKKRELIKKTHEYSWNFYRWKKEGNLSKNWQAYEKKICPRCDIPLEKTYLGKTKRLSFFCTNCQILF